jgi:hypothetical protein
MDTAATRWSLASDRNAHATTIAQIIWRAETKDVLILAIALHQQLAS